MLLGDDVAVHTTEEVVLADHEEVAGGVPGTVFGAGVPEGSGARLVGLEVAFGGVGVFVDGLGDAEIPVAFGADVGGFFDVRDDGGVAQDCL